MDTNNFKYMTDKELAEFLLSRGESEDVIPALFHLIPMHCSEICKLDYRQLDMLIDKFQDNGADQKELLAEIISLFRSVLSKEDTDRQPYVENIKNYIQEHLCEEISISQIAAALQISYHYMCHLFKDVTGKTVNAYRTEQRIRKAKRMLVDTSAKISDIAVNCGFDNLAYFTEVFTKLTGMPPTHFRTVKKDTAYFSYYRDEDDTLAEMLPSLRFTEGNLNIDYLSPDLSVATYPVSMPDSEYRFLHEAAVIEFHGTLFAAWYNNPKTELNGRTPIRSSLSYDGGKTWTEPAVIADDPEGKILYCPPIYGICDDKLYLFLNEMVAADHMHALDLYVYEEEEGIFTKLWSRPIPFKLNTNVITLPNGKLMLPGRIGEMDALPTIPAVLISDNGKIDAPWRLVKITDTDMLPDGVPFLFPEITPILAEGKIYMFCRDDHRRVPLVFLSEDNGESWTGPYAHDVPIANSKIYSGTLSDGRNYIITNIGAEKRKRLLIFLSAPNQMRFTEYKLLRSGNADDFPTATQWHYPVAIESDGMLKIICTVSFEDKSRGAALITLPL